MTPCELDITYNLFCDTKKFTYEIELPTSGKKVGFNILDDEDFKTPYITDKIKNWPDGHQIPTQAKWKVSIIDTNRKIPIKTQGALDELNQYQTTGLKTKVRISLCRRKRYQRTDIEEIFYRFDQVRSVVSHLEVSFPKKPTTPKNICEGLKVPQRQWWK